MLSLLFQGNRKTVLLRAGFLIAVFAFINWRAINELPLGFLYLLPMLMVGRVLNPLQIAGIAALCTVLTERFDAFVWNFRTGLPRDVLYFAAFFCVGLFVYEVNRNRQIVTEHLHEIERQRDARRDAEEQLKILIESSPAAIVTADADGRVLMANEAAHRMLTIEVGALPGRSIERYFPSLANILRRDTNRPTLRAVMQSRGQREDSDVFLADICFSTYLTDAGPRLAAMILDTSEELRTREEASLHQMLAGSRIVAGAVSHEIRNICGAIAVVHENLLRSGLLAQNKDFEALGNLVLALERISDVELRQSADQAAEVDLLSVLDDLRIVIAPWLREEGIEVAWTLPPDLPPVWADRSNLMQVFLNLTTNSIRALSQKTAPKLSIIALAEDHRVLVEITDNGGGVDHPEQLFRPFQPGARSTGLGLYVSRAFMRSFGGELRYKTLANGACFIVELSPVDYFEKVS
ncbi:MAG TPA: ATP-binding protein [Pseudacidobacterium sp.]|jgi:PAS domain S-box-containing protein|nr:ATP-binding protein [Pseudacidobacterium sp.]